MGFRILKSIIKDKILFTKKNKREKKSGNRKYSEQELAKIQERAYCVWERKGMPDNNDYEDWVEAEQELIDEGLL